MTTTPAPTLTRRLAGWLLNNPVGCAHQAVYRTGDKGECVHLAPRATRGRAPTLCGIDRTDNGQGVGRGRRHAHFYTGSWRRIVAVTFEGRHYLGALLAWRPADRHLCRVCLRNIPR